MKSAHCWATPTSDSLKRSVSCRLILSVPTMSPRAHRHDDAAAQLPGVYRFVQSPREMKALVGERITGEEVRHLAAKHHPHWAEVGWQRMFCKIAPAGVEACFVARMTAAFVEQHRNVHMGMRNERLDLDGRRTKRRPGVDMPGQGARDRQEPVDQYGRDARHGLMPLLLRAHADGANDALCRQTDWQ